MINIEELPEARFRTKRGRPTNDSCRVVILACIRELMNHDNWCKECYGKRWAKVTQAALLEMTGLTPRQVQYSLKTLVAMGVLAQEKLNATPFDQTRWYAINEEE